MSLNILIDFILIKKKSVLQHTLVRPNDSRTEAQWIALEAFFQIENTVSKLEEDVGIRQITEISTVNWAIIICTFLIFAHTFGHET